MSRTHILTQSLAHEHKFPHATLYLKGPILENFVTYGRIAGSKQTNFLRFFEIYVRKNPHLNLNLKMNKSRFLEHKNGQFLKFIRAVPSAMARAKIVSKC